MNTALKRFMFRAYALDLLQEAVIIEDVGLTIEQFEKLDELLAVYLEQMDVDELKEELIEIVKELTKDAEPDQ